MKQLKKIHTLLVIVVVASCINTVSAGQISQNRQPKWVSEKGYWVVETEGANRKNHIIHFYNNDNQLVYRESLNGVSLKTSKRVVKMKLKKILETSVVAWEQKKEKTENLALVAKSL